MGWSEIGEMTGRLDSPFEEADRFDIGEGIGGPPRRHQREAMGLVVTLGVEEVQRQQPGLVVGVLGPGGDGLTGPSVQFPAQPVGQAVVGALAQQSVGEADGVALPDEEPGQPLGKLVVDRLIHHGVEEVDGKAPPEDRRPPQEVPVAGGELIDPGRTTASTESGSSSTSTPATAARRSRSGTGGSLRPVGQRRPRYDGAGALRPSSGPPDRGRPGREGPRGQPQFRLLRGPQTAAPSRVGR